jgi:hypothetical protein
LEFVAREGGEGWSAFVSKEQAGVENLNLIHQIVVDQAGSKLATAFNEDAGEAFAGKGLQERF